MISETVPRERKKVEQEQIMNWLWWGSFGKGERESVVLYDSFRNWITFTFSANCLQAFICLFVCLFLVLFVFYSLLFLYVHVSPLPPFSVSSPSLRDSRYSSKALLLSIPIPNGVTIIEFCIFFLWQKPWKSKWINERKEGVRGAFSFS
mgnify:CR=1 FL=1